MKNGNNCNCNGNNNGGGRRRRRGCMKLARGYWDNFPYYTGPCPAADTCCRWYKNCDDDDDDDERGCDRDCDYERDCDRDRRRGGGRRRRRRGGNGGPCGGMFVAFLPVAVSANGIIPLVFNHPCRDADFEVNSGLITLEEPGTYLASYTVNVPETAALDTTMTLNVENAAQASATTRVLTAAGDAASEFSGQAIFQADEGDTVSLRTSDAISVTETAVPPMFTLSLVKLA
ncbi:MAG: hypothetical protein IJ646_00440 [Clostridia bacterium]|nr:hypothetical protein [Clostridia bacterium]